jgi:uncharacterized membrane protein
MTKNIKLRLVATILAVLVAGFVNMLLNPPATGVPLDNSGAGFAGSIYGMQVAGMLVIPAIVLLVVVVAIWWRPLLSRAARSPQPTRFPR